MAIHIVNDQTFAINAVDLTSHLIDLEVSETAALLNSTTQGVANQTRFRGKKHFTARVRLQQDYASSLVHDTIQAVLDANPAQETMTLGASTTAGDVSYTGEWTIGDYTSIPGGEGMAEIEISIEAAGAITVGAVV